MQNITINLPDTIAVAMGKDSGKRMNVESKRLPANVLEAIVVAGVKVILTNVYNGEGKDAKQDDREAKVQKKLDAWYRGEFNVVARGDSILTAMREVYILDTIAKYKAAGTEVTIAEVEKSIKATVTSVFGEKESATFGKFIDAMARLIARNEHGPKATEEQIAEAREAFESHYAKLVEERAAKQAKAAEKLDLSSLALASFAKKAD